VAKQRLGKKKHAQCEEIAGMKFSVCYVRGGRTHGQAECWLVDENTAYWVNYLTKEGPELYINKGK
jgi:hypothetical protein